MVGSKCSLKMHVQNLGYPFHLQIRGTKTTFLGRLRNSMAILTAFFLRVKHGIHKCASALQTARGLLHRLKTTWTLAQKWLQIGYEFSPILRKFCIPLHCQASQTEISKRNSTKLCQTVDGRPRYQSAVEKLGSSLHKNGSQKPFTFVLFFDNLET